MAPKFKYQARKSEDWEKRENQSGSSYIGFIKDQFETYSVKTGENWIRILPPTWADPKHYGLDIWVHFGVGPQNASVLCTLKMENKPCPVCEARMQAEDRGQDNADDFKPTRRVLVWLLDRKDEKKPLAWAMPWTVDRDLTKCAHDRMTGELYHLDDPEGGYDVSFDREGTSGTQQVKYVGMQVARKPSPVAEAYVNYIVEHPLPDILVHRSYAEVHELLAGQPAAAAAPSPAAAPQQPVAEQGPAKFEGRIKLEENPTPAAATVESAKSQSQEQPQPVQSAASIQTSRSETAAQPAATTGAAVPAVLSRAEVLRARFAKK